jgi:O-antigen ligase
VTSLEMLVGAVALLVLVLLIARPMVGIVAFAFAYPLYLVGPRLPVPGMNIETTLVGVAMALTLLRFGLRIPPPRYSLPVICLMLVLLASWLIGGTSLPRFAPDVGLWDLFRAVKSLLFTSLLFFVGYWWFQDRTDRTRLLEAISFGTGIFALTGIADFAIGFSQSARFASRAASFFQNPNMLADFLAAFSLVALYLIRQPEVTRTRRGLHLCVWGASMVAIVLTLSRSGWLGVLAGHGVWFLYVNRQLFAVGFVTVVLAATIAFPLLPAIVQERVERTTSGGVLITSMSELGALEGSAAFRILMYRIGLEMLWDSPLWGHGLQVRDPQAQGTAQPAPQARGGGRPARDRRLRLDLPHHADAGTRTVARARPRLHARGPAARLGRDDPDDEPLPDDVLNLARRVRLLLAPLRSLRAPLHGRRCRRRRVRGAGRASLAGGQSPVARGHLARRPVPPG